MKLVGMSSYEGLNGEKVEVNADGMNHKKFEDSAWMFIIQVGLGNPQVSCCQIRFSTMKLLVCTAGIMIW